MYYSNGKRSTITYLLKTVIVLVGQECSFVAGCREGDKQLQRRESVKHQFNSFLRLEIQVI